MLEFNSKEEMDEFANHWAEKTRIMLKEAKVLNSWEAATYGPNDTVYYPPKSIDEMIKEIGDKIKLLTEMIKKS